MDEVLSRRERKKLATRQRLVQASLDLLLTNGYDETTVEQIADAADVAKGTFFNYFETKEAILPAVAEWRMREILEVVTVERGAPESPVSRIRLLLRSVAADPISDPRVTHHLVAAGDPVHSEPVRAFARLLADMVAQGQAAGEIRADLEPLQVGALLRAGFFQQMMMWHCGYRPSPLPELLDSMVDLLMDGIAPRPDGQAQ
jgi:AcrR family transcriptional regulator